MKAQKWLIKRTNDDFLRYLARKIDVSKNLAQILVNRGLKNKEDAYRFLNPSLNQLHNPMLLPDMERAVKRIIQAVSKKEKVLVFGDYDVDGITATSLMVMTLQTLGLETGYYIPDRIEEGYGFNSRGIRKAINDKASLIITVDCGISSFEEVTKAASSGIDVIITDHHIPLNTLPKAKAVINPNRFDSLYPFKSLAGVGVAFKLCQVLLKKNWEQFLDLTAIGTLADSVPLVGENRILVYYGLKQINNNCRVGLNALHQTTGSNTKYISSGFLTYKIIPRLNAAGRLSKAAVAVEILMTEEPKKAKTLALHLDELNRKRKIIEDAVYQAALVKLRRFEDRNAFVLASRHWHPGVLGIVASRLAEEFYRPVFLLTTDGIIAKGSARSIAPFHLYNGIEQCSDILGRFGGHSQAAGLSLPFGNIDIFRRRIDKIVKETLSREDYIQTLQVDLTASFKEINYSLIKEIDKLEPFGYFNEEPKIGVKGLTVVDPHIVGKGHLKMRLQQDSVILGAIGFGMGNMVEKLLRSPIVDAVFSPTINEYNGIKSLQLNLKGLRLITKS